MSIAEAGMFMLAVVSLVTLAIYFYDRHKKLKAKGN